MRTEKEKVQAMIRLGEKWIETHRKRIVEIEKEIEKEEDRIEGLRNQLFLLDDEDLDELMQGCPVGTSKMEPANMGYYDNYVKGCSGAR